MAKSLVKHLGQYTPEPPPEEDEPDPNLNQIPVHVGKITIQTLHRYVDGYGIVAPRPPRKAQMSGTANVASLISGQVAKVDCQIGQTVKAGDTLIELDTRAAKAAEDQASAGLAQEQAAMAALKAQPRPEQVQLAQLAIEKAQSAVDVAQKTYDRQKQLLAGQGASAKTVEQAAADLASAGSDLQTARKQMDLLKATPAPEELAQEQAKLNQATAALAAAKLQTELATIKAPIDATVTAITINPGEPVDPTKPLVTLIAMDRLMVDLDVPADELPVKPDGLAAVVTLANDPNPDADKITLDATVTFVAPQVESKNGAVMVGIDLPADAVAKGLLPGRTVRVRIVAQEHKNVLAVPREAIVLDDNGDASVAVVTDSIASLHTVKVGLDENDLVEIDTDLKEGTTIVTQGTFGLRTVDQTLQQTRVRVIEPTADKP
jgi:multidrug efflux pump subunit AcrA (membrane-fusion protein)